MEPNSKVGKFTFKNFELIMPTKLQHETVEDAGEGSRQVEELCIQLANDEDIAMEADELYSEIVDFLAVAYKTVDVLFFPVHDATIHALNSEGSIDSKCPFNRCKQLEKNR